MFWAISKKLNRLVLRRKRLLQGCGARRGGTDRALAPPRIGSAYDVFLLRQLKFRRVDGVCCASTCCRVLP